MIESAEAIPGCRGLSTPAHRPSGSQLLVTAGGRVLTGRRAAAPASPKPDAPAYAGVGQISFDGMQYPTGYRTKGARPRELAAHLGDQPPPPRAGHPCGQGIPPPPRRGWRVRSPRLATRSAVRSLFSRDGRLAGRSLSSFLKFRPCPPRKHENFCPDEAPRHHLRLPRQPGRLLGRRGRLSSARRGDEAEARRGRSRHRQHVFRDGERRPGGTTDDPAGSRASIRPRKSSSQAATPHVGPTRLSGLPNGVDRELSRTTTSRSSSRSCVARLRLPDFA